MIENTSICNLTCIHCSHRELQRTRRHMKRELWNKIVEEFGANSPDTEIWPTFYGEALIMGYKSELWDRLDYAAKVGCRNLVLNSNGTLLHRWDNIEKILGLAVATLHPQPRRPIEGDIRAHSRKGQMGRGLSGGRGTVPPAACPRGQKYPVIIAQFSVMKQNAHEVDAYRAYWEARGAEVKVRPMLEWTATGTVRTDTIVHDSEFRIACPWGNNTMAIHQDGSVVCCAVDYEGKVKVGNVNEITVKEAWRRLGERCDARIASIAGTTFPTCARAAAIGRLPAPSSEENRSRVRGRSGTMTQNATQRGRLSRRPKPMLT